MIIYKLFCFDIDNFTTADKEKHKKYTKIKVKNPLSSLNDLQHPRPITKVFTTDPTLKELSSKIH